MIIDAVGSWTGQACGSLQRSRCTMVFQVTLIKTKDAGENQNAPKLFQGTYDLDCKSGVQPDRSVGPGVGRSDLERLNVRDSKSLSLGTGANLVLWARTEDSGAVEFFEGHRPKEKRL